MQTTPKSLRLHIALFGRMNVGKSSLLNLIAGEAVAITSEQPGTTTDVVSKSMELLPIGPVVLLDTAGLDDRSALAEERLAAARRTYDRADVILLVCESGRFGADEEAVLAEAERRKIPVVAVVTKIDCVAPAADAVERLRERCGAVVLVNTRDASGRNRVLGELKAALLERCPDEYVSPPPLVGDLVPAGGLIVMVVPIDLQAPRGRLILPQVQTLRDALDSDAAGLVVKEREYAHWLGCLKRPPELVVCDSQVVLKMVADTPPGVPCTTFSILFARLKGDLVRLARGVAALDALRDGDRVLIAESCSHHALADDIGRVKIPRWIRQYTGAELTFQTHAGRDFPADVGEYRLIVQCGGCMNTRRELLARMERADSAGVPMTNYGLCIAATQGVLSRVLSPFPAAADAYARARDDGRRRA